jgi:NAD(P)-dependent dehydrogenase (short-subunit alcohol dehydrogenase family)
MKTVFITNTHSPLGYTLVHHYLAYGAYVFAASPNPSVPDPLRMLSARYPDKMTVLCLDMMDRSHMTAALDVVRSKTTVLDLLINNTELNSALYLDSLKNAAYAFRMNAIAPILLARKFVDLLQNSDNPKIINLAASDEAFYDAEAFSGSTYNYSTSKQALQLYSQGLAADLSEYGIEVMMLDVGCLQTGFSKWDEGSVRPIISNTVARITACIDYPSSLRAFERYGAGGSVQA